jgi:hypothetical protein
MEYDERAEELQREADRLEHESERLKESTDQARSEWDARKSDPSGAPGAAEPEAAGPHSIDDEDPASGKAYGEKRRQEIEDVKAIDSEQDEGNDST